VAPSGTVKSVTRAFLKLYERKKIFEKIFKASLSPDVTVDVPPFNGTLREAPVSLETLREFIAILWAKYQSLEKRAHKASVLDAITTTLGVHRKSALRLMNAAKSYCQMLWMSLRRLPELYPRIRAS
jgi:hypothetical protein